MNVQMNVSESLSLCFLMSEQMFFLLSYKPCFTAIAVLKHETNVQSVFTKSCNKAYPACRVYRLPQLA
jgi:Fe2+ transport system protein B